MIRKTNAEHGSGLKWFKSSYSDSSSGNDCVEVAATATAVLVRDSKDLQGPRLGLAPTAWASFVAYASER
ncbi:DUF397 domain-containing protein [Streptomyces niveus]|uniref:DUF397 domain-containing protein n=1 Tax=Streptomyces niveus TaxID=193462 RepID=A0A1U9QRY9_STRNV|nr:DUF397 domain-containing protein [Streptomyces niveus]AQU67016.1 DUF397 domain-containing protein [Streptomyces niveus]